MVREGTGARVAFVGPDDPEPTGAAATAVVTLDPMGRGLDEPPGGGAFDYLTEARMAGDQYRPLFPVPGDTAALFESTVDEILAEARARAAKLGLSADDRVLSTRDWSGPEGILDGLLVPLAMRRAPGARQQRGPGQAVRPPRGRAHHGRPPRVSSLPRPS